jgi:enoyl-[acyl-carrier-protein] reductase (NADH)
VPASVRMVKQGEEAGGGAVWLISDEGHYVTGITPPVDSGFAVKK